uniref:Uncharacterized protein n=1 Tax=Arundo donax TaxID=35708 RepID=A0A0A9DBB2_ARUDO
MPYNCLNIKTDAPASTHHLHVTVQFTTSDYIALPICSRQLRFGVLFREKNVDQYKPVIPIARCFILQFSSMEEVVSEPKPSSMFFDISPWMVISNAKKILASLVLSSGFSCAGNVMVWFVKPFLSSIT